MSEIIELTDYAFMPLAEGRSTSYSTANQLSEKIKVKVKSANDTDLENKSKNIEVECWVMSCQKVECIENSFSSNEQHSYKYIITLSPINK